MKTDYVVVNINGNYANVYDFCTPESAEEVIKKAIEQARKTVETYNSCIVNYPDRADYWKECWKQYETAKYELMMFDEFLKRQKQIMLSGGIKEITKEEFDEKLNALPPLKFCRRNNMEMFCMSEMYAGTYTTQYAFNLVDSKYYKAMVDITDPETWINKRL